MQKAPVITERHDDITRAWDFASFGRVAVPLQAIDFCSRHRYPTPARCPLAVDQRWLF